MFQIWCKLLKKKYFVLKAQQNDFSDYYKGLQGTYRVKFLQSKEVYHKATAVWTEAFLDVHVCSECKINPCSFLPPSQTAAALKLVWLTAPSSLSLTAVY